MILVNQGTVATDPSELLQPALAALAGEDALVVAVTGGRDPSELGLVPANARVERFIPFERLLPHVDVLVTNGGFGAVQLALAAGVPIVAAGQTEDKVEVSARVGWSGVGINLRTQTPPPGLHHRRRPAGAAAIRATAAGLGSCRPRSPPPVGRTVPPTCWRSSWPAAPASRRRACNSGPAGCQTGQAQIEARARIGPASGYPQVGWTGVTLSLVLCQGCAFDSAEECLHTRRENTVGLQALAKRAAVLVAVGCLALGCTPQPGVPTPSPSPTATTAPTPPETARERQERLDFEAAEKAYRTFRAEFGRVLQSRWSQASRRGS